MKLYTKQVLYALVPLFLAAVGALVLAFLISFQDIAVSFSRTAHAEMGREATLVEHFFQDKQLILETIAATPRLRGNDVDAKLQYLEREQQRLGGHFEGLYLNDMDGNVHGEDGSSFNVSDRPYFASVTRGQVTVSDIIESRGTGTRIVVLLVPIRSFNGEQIGALGGAIPIDHIIAELEHEQLDYEGSLLLIDSAGTLLVDHAVPAILDDALAHVIADPALDLRQPHTAVAGDYFFTVQRASMLNWILVIYRPRLSIYSSLISASWKVSLVFLLGMLAAMVFSMAATRWVMSPLQELREQLRAIGRGERNVRLRDAGDDELGAIARVFNTMARRLQERETQLRSLTEGMAEGFAVCELVCNGDGQVVDYRFLDINPAFAGLLGLDERNAIEQLASTVLRASPPPFLDVFSQAHESKEAISADVRYGKKEQFFHVSVVSPREGVYTILLLDVTEGRRSEAMRLEMERRLLHAQKLESLGVLAGGIAHDFNNLLMAAMGNLELASEELPKSSPARESVDNAQAATRRAADLTRQMLAYSGRAQFVVDTIDLNTLVSENAQMSRTAIARNVTMTLDLAETRVEMKGDTSQIQQVIMNLITNASEAIGETAGEVRIATGILRCDADYLARSHTSQKPRPGEFVFVEVADSGSGMSADTIERVFEPFFTTKFTGRGLGMASVLGVVQGHGGGIFVSSREGVGTIMRVLFPALPEPSPVAIHASGEDVASGTSYDQTPKILVVDDEDMVRSLCARMVRSFGYEALTASDGDEGIDLLRAHGDAIDCVLLDMAMPRKNGAETLREMRDIAPQLPVIVCTGFADDAAQAGLNEHELSGFLHKPYQVEALRTTLDRVLQKRGSEADA